MEHHDTSERKKNTEKKSRSVIRRKRPQWGHTHLKMPELLLLLMLQYTAAHVRSHVEACCTLLLSSRAFAASERTTTVVIIRTHSARAATHPLLDHCNYDIDLIFAHPQGRRKHEMFRIISGVCARMPNNKPTIIAYSVCPSFCLCKQEAFGFGNAGTHICNDIWFEHVTTQRNCTYKQTNNISSQWFYQNLM